MTRLAFLLTCMLPCAAHAAPSFHTDDYAGLGVVVAPAHPGAGTRDAGPVPVVDIERGPWIVRTTQGVPEAAAVVGLGAGVKLGLAASIGAGRRSDDVPAFAGRGVPDLDAVLAIGPLLEASTAVGPVPVRLTWRWRQAVQSDRGASSDLRFAAGLFDGGGVRLNAFVQTTWADATARSAAFGVSASASAASGLGAVAFPSGRTEAALGLGLRWDVHGPWSLVASAERRRLDRALAAGPVAESTSATAVAVGLVYRLP